MMAEDNISLYNLETSKIGAVPRESLQPTGAQEIIYAPQTFEDSSIDVLGELLDDLPAFYADIRKITMQAAENKLKNEQYRATADHKAYRDRIKAMMGGNAEKAAENGVNNLQGDNPHLRGSSQHNQSGGDIDGDGIPDMVDTSNTVSGFGPADYNKDGIVSSEELQKWSVLQNKGNI